MSLSSETDHLAADSRTEAVERLAVVGLWHEANTFSTVHATLDDYRNGGIATGTELVRRHATSRSTIAGYLADPGVDVLPLAYAAVRPCGPVSQ